MYAFFVYNHSAIFLPQYITIPAVQSDIHLSGSLLCFLLCLSEYTIRILSKEK